MKITPATTVISALLFAAGCSSEQHQARYDDSVSPDYSSGRMSEYNPSRNENNSSPPAASTRASSAMISGNISGPKSDSESDNVIVAEVRESLRRNEEIAPIVPNLQISANNGSILLNGSVQSEEQKRQIGVITQQTVGVVTVNNQLKVLLNPTGEGGATLPRLYKEPGEGMDHSTNSVLNPTSLPNGDSKIYQESNPGQNAPELNTNMNQMP
jgi:hypothetical protein